MPERDTLSMWWDDVCDAQEAEVESWADFTRHAERGLYGKEWQEAVAPYDPDDDMYQEEDDQSAPRRD